ncbi:hypothetical protein ABT294_13235 [Nonomuraea sp. NPDC000554]|uniref:hypothetical protein n=1 Tax=Nonomuraea sp. NPDC000554 TaxID=3154259 RepID=UPI00331E964C
MVPLSRAATACLALLLSGCAGTSAPPAPTASAAPPAPAASTASTDPAASPGVELYDVSELRPGDCIEPMPQEAIVTVVPCGTPHSAEFATVYVLPQGDYPAVNEMRRLAENGCWPRMRIKESKRDRIGVTWLGPDEASWPRSRTVYCFAAPYDGRKLAGRVVK